MPYTYTLTALIPATPREIYEAWLDSVAHSEMTGGDANVSGEVGGEFSAWDEYITGRNVELVPAERIVQSWRTDEYDDEHEDSTITITFEETDDGTLLTLVHSNVPDDQTHYEESGWESNYFEPMRAYFARRERQVPDAEPPSASPPASADEPPPAGDDEPQPTGGYEPQPAADPKPERAEPRPKAARPAKRAKRAVTAKPKRKTAKPSAKKPAKRKTAKPTAKKSAKKPAKKPAKRKARKTSRRPRAHR
jgi:uncharacterized protein YndB with AHSA1/START domain